MGAESKVRRNVKTEPARASASRPSHRSLMPRAQKGCARRSHLLLPLAFVFFLPSACALYNPTAFIKSKDVPQEKLSEAAQITLQWDPPASGGSQVVSYAVSYRIHGTSPWQSLATIPAIAQPSYTVLRSVIGTGTFDFAVASVDSSGQTSPLHTSLDPTADPTSGWYLSWGQ
jgi:hypothetical protein